MGFVLFFNACIRCIRFVLLGFLQRLGHWSARHSDQTSGRGSRFGIRNSKRREGLQQEWQVGTAHHSPAPCTLLLWAGGTAAHVLHAPRQSAGVSLLIERQELQGDVSSLGASPINSLRCFHAGSSPWSSCVSGRTTACECSSLVRRLTFWVAEEQSLTPITLCCRCPTKNCSTAGQFPMVSLSAFTFVFLVFVFLFNR